jgi:hypothetical protein
MKLTEEWRHAWKWLQVQLGAVIALAPEIFEQTKTMQGHISDASFHRIMSGLGILLILNAARKKR